MNRRAGGRRASRDSGRGGLDERFTGLPGPRWKRFITGKGTLLATECGLRLVTTNASRQAYSDAQIDDYQGLPRRDFLWRPPLTLHVQARFSHPPATAAGPGLLGTAGFGFWNDPFMMTGARLPALPAALWFFYASPPSNMKLATNTPGLGWKAATIDAGRLPARLALLTAPLAIPLLNLAPIYRRLWPPAQRLFRIAEASVPAAMTEWHYYRLAWSAAEAVFTVDDREVLRCPFSPAGPLGLVIWLDNQYLIATPWGRYRYGLLDAPGSQWMELARVKIEQPAA